MQVEFHALAEARLLEIWSYTEENWGDAQADRYIRELMDAAHQLSDPVYAGRPVNDPELPGVYFIRYQHHFVFFRRLSKSKTGVINILHESMDIPARLKADLP